MINCHRLMLRWCWAVCLLANHAGAQELRAAVASPGVVVTDRDSIAREMQRTLDEELARWYPACVDSVDGGYLSDFDFAWVPRGPQNKMIVTQARHIWSASAACMYDARYLPLIAYAAHGAAFLRSRMWDSTYGGFYDLVDRRGRPIAERGRLIKRAYGNAFAIYGLAAYFRASHDSSALRLAQNAFRWLEKHSYDPLYGGYFQFMQRDGTPFTRGYDGTPPKDYNSLIHLLESFTELYRVWKDPLVHERLSSLLRIVRDTLTADRGYLKLYFNRDWTQPSGRSAFEFDHVSFGHDAETGYLLLEASEALSLRDDATTLHKARKMVDHTIAYGMDSVNGGVFDAGSYAGGSETKPAIVKRTKEWWAQAEAFNAFLLMAHLFPDDEHGRYYDRFCAQWNYCKRFLIDRERGGWYWGGTDIVPDNVRSPKGSIWKGSYHTSRALINCITRLGKKGGS